MGSLLALVLVPWPVALLTVPRLAEVYASVPAGALVAAVLFGIGWGLGGIFWGKAIAALGVALGVSLLMGLLNVFGSPVLLAFTQGPGKLVEPGGLVLLAAVAVMVLGVVVCAATGRYQGKGTPWAGGRHPLLHAVCRRADLLHSFRGALGNGQLWLRLRRADQAGGPQARGPPGRRSQRHLGPGLQRQLRRQCPVRLRLDVPQRHHRPAHSDGSLRYWLWALFMGISWPLGIVLFGIGADRMGGYGAFVAFPMMLVMAILFGNLAGALTGEWRGTSRRPRLVMLAGVAVLAAAFAIFGVASRMTG